VVKATLSLGKQVIFVNGDGFDDILIGSRLADPNGINSGESYIIYGQANSVFELSSLLAENGGDGSMGFVINGIDTRDYSGVSVSSAGDINGDGFDEILIGASKADPSEKGLGGESYLIFGRQGGFGASLEVSNLNGNNGFIINGIDRGDYSGRSLSSAGDMNGDGFDDIIIGARRADPNGTYSGESYVVFGQAGGFEPSLELQSLNGTTGFVINGINANEYSGFSVSSAGDVNGDGFDDIIIGAPGSYASNGMSYVVFGHASEFEASLELSTLNGSNGFIINGKSSVDASGISVSSAGDVNNDGYDDLLIGAYFASPNGDRSGESYVIFGHADGFGVSFELSTLNGINGFAMNGINPGDYSGHSVSSAGDFNGDGFEDILVGAFRADPNGNFSGESYIVFGKRNGFESSLELSSLDGTNGFVLIGSEAYDNSGRSLSSAGDINGDGFDDILIGKNRSEGGSYVVFGRAGGFEASLELSSLNGTNGFVINGIDTGDGSGRSVSSPIAPTPMGVIAVRATSFMGGLILDAQLNFSLLMLIAIQLPIAVKLSTASQVMTSSMAALPVMSLWARTAMIC